MTRHLLLMQALQINYNYLKITILLLVIPAFLYIFAELFFRNQRNAKVGDMQS